MFKDVACAFGAENGIRYMLHGGLWEAALNYAINPEYFQPELLDETKYPQHFGPLRDYYAASGVTAKPLSRLQAVCKVSSPRDAQWYTGNSSSL